MKAIRAHQFGGPEVLQLDEIDDPVPAAGEIVIEMKAAAVNPSDTYMRTGAYAIKPDLPYIPGGDGAGVVVAVGNDVNSISVGTRVATGSAFGPDFTGCYAEKILRKAEDVLVLPDNVSFAQATALGVSYPTAQIALFQRGRAKAGETLFIHGASGSVGTAAIQLAKHEGLKIIGSAGTEQGLALIKEQGVDLAVDHTKDGYIDQVRDFTDGRGVDLTLEMLANVNLDKDLDLAAKFGRIVIIGNRGEITINPRVAMMKDLDVMGMALWNWKPMIADGARFTAADMKEMMQSLLDLMASNDISPVTGKEVPLADAARAHEMVLEPGAHGKLVLVP